MRVALVHDYFTQLGGAERVAEVLYATLPNPTLFTTMSDPKRLPAGLRRARIQNSWMQRLPAREKLYRHYFPLYPLAVRSLDLSGYDLVVSSSSGYGKGVRADRSAIHVCYCHTPMRWIWRFDDYCAREKFSASQRLILPLLIRQLKKWDINASRQPDQYVVNSRAVAERVRLAYGRNAVVIPPPIDVNRFTIGNEQDDFYLVLSRLVSYKRIDLAIEACLVANRRLVVIGDGPDRARLQYLGGTKVEFLGRAADEVVESYVRKCRALIFPGEEDFGMVPLEVNAAGRPVIAYHAGGAIETVVDGLNGVFFHDSTVQSLVSAIEDFEHRSWDPQAIRRHAEQFGTDVFQEKILNLLSSFVRLPQRASLTTPQNAAIAVA